jgi:hypothetical protein
MSAFGTKPTAFIPENSSAFITTCHHSGWEKQRGSYLRVVTSIVQQDGCINNMSEQRNNDTSPALSRGQQELVLLLRVQ